MSAAALSSFCPVLDRLAAAVPSGVPTGSPQRLLEVFARVPDPRKRRGVCHRLAVLLTLATCAVLTGARSYVAIGEWAAGCDDATREALGIVRVPQESTFRRVLACLDTDALDAALGRWVAAPPTGQCRQIAVDGKTLRGSRSGDTAGHYLLAALDHASGGVLSQVDVNTRTNEILRLPDLLDTVELSGPSPCTPSARPRPGLSTTARTTCSRSRPTSRRCTPSFKHCPGNRSAPPPARPAVATPR